MLSRTTLSSEPPWQKFPILAYLESCLPVLVLSTNVRYKLDHCFHYLSVKKGR